MSANDEIELKPCPFCGSKAEFTSGWCNDLTYARVDCAGCSAVIYNDSDRAPGATMDELERSVLDDWNRRVENA